MRVGWGGCEGPTKGLIFPYGTGAVRTRMVEGKEVVDFCGAPPQTPLIKQLKSNCLLVS
jgi:hypothetical protein